MKVTGNNDSLQMPPALLAQVQAAAEEHRPAGELLHDAVELYLEDREWDKLYTYGEERACALGLAEDDVPRLIAEYRQEKRQGR